MITFDKTDFTPFTLSVHVDTPEQATYLSCMFGDNPDNFMKHVTAGYKRELSTVFPDELVKSVADAGWQLFDQIESSGDYETLLDIDLLYNAIEKYAGKED